MMTRKRAWRGQRPAAVRLAFVASARLLRFQIPETGLEILDTARLVTQQYASLGLDLADVVNVALAAQFRTDAVLTLDQRGFRAMRPLTPHRWFRILPTICSQSLLAAPIDAAVPPEPIIPSTWSTPSPASPVPRGPGPRTARAAIPGAGSQPPRQNRPSSQLGPGVFGADQEPGPRRRPNRSPCPAATYQCCRPTRSTSVRHLLAAGA